MEIENFLIQRNYTHKPAENIKNRILRLFHEILTNYNVNSKIYCCLLLIQMCQILSFTIHSSYQGLWSSEIVKKAIMIISVVNSAYIWPYVGFVGLLIFLLTSISILMIILIFFLHQILKRQRQHPNDHNVIAFTIVSYFDSLLRTILFLPIFLSFGYAYKIQVDSDALRIIFIFLASIGHILLISISLGLSCFVVDNSPFSSLPFSMPLSKIELYKLILKIFLGIYGSLQLSENRLNTLFLVMIIIGLSFIAFNFYKGIRLMYEPFRTIYQLTIIISLWFGIISLVQQLITSSQNLSLLYLTIGTVILSFVWKGIQNHKTNILLKSNYKTISSDFESVRYNIQCIRNCINYSDAESIISLEGILSYHKIFCKKSKDNCPCFNLKQKINEFRFDKTNQELNEQLRCWYEFIKVNLLQAKSKFKNNPELSLLLAYVQTYQLRNKFRALYNLEDYSQFSNGPICQFLNYHSKRTIQELIFGQDLMKNEKKTVNINQFFEFEICFYELQQIIEQSANDHLGFWQKLKSDSISRSKILQQGKLITKSVKKVAKIYKKLIKLNPNNIQMLLLYGNFTRIILKYPDIYEKNTEHIQYLKQQNKNIQVLDFCKKKYNDNALTGIIIISGERKDIGSIKHCNSKITEILKYSPYQLIAQNVNVLMPKFIGNMHDDVLRNYLELENSQYDFVQRLAPMVDKDNYMILVSILTKPLPSLLNGLLLIGIFNQVTQRNEHHDNQMPKYLLYRSDTGYIEALSQTCFTECGYRKAKLDQANETSVQLQVSSIFATNQKLINQLTEGKPMKAQIKMKDIDEEMVKNEVDVYLKHQILYFGTKLRLLEFYLNSHYINNQRQSLAILYDKNLAQSKINELQSQAGQKLSKLGKSQISQIMEDKLLQQKINIYPLSLRIMGKIGLLYLVLLLIISSLLFAFDLNIGPLVQQSSILAISTFKTLGKVIDIAYYSRLMHLSKIFQDVQQIKQFLQFDQLQRNVSILNHYLQKQQFDLVNLQLKIKESGFDINEQITQYQSVLQNSSKVTFRRQTVSMNDGLFSYITSASSYSSTAKDNLLFNLSLPDTQGPYNDYEAFNNLFHIHYTALYSLIEKKFDYNNKIYEYYRQQLRSKILWIILFCLMFIVILAIFTLILMFLGTKVENITQHLLLLFGFLSISQVNQEIYNCQLFLEIFYEDSYFVRLKRRAQSRDVTLNKQDSFEIETVKLKRFSTNAIQASSEFSKVQLGGRISITNALPQGHRLQLMEKKFQQLSSSKQLINTQPINNNNNTINSGTSQNNQENEEKLFQKLQQSSNCSKLPLWIRGLIFFTIFSLFGIVRVIYLVQFIEDRNADVNLLQVITKNMNLLRAVNLYGLQSTIDDKKGQFQEFSIKQMFATYIQKLQLQEKQVSYLLSQQKQLPHFSNLHNNQKTSICTKIETINNLLPNFKASSFTLQQCEQIANGILKQGQRASLIGLLEMLKNITQTSSKQNTFESTINQVLIDQQFHHVYYSKKYIEGIFQSFSKSLKDSISENIQGYRKMIIIYFIVICLTFGVFFLICRPRILRWLKLRFRVAMQISTLIPKKIFNKNNKMMKQYEKIEKFLIT